MKQNGLKINTFLYITILLIFTLYQVSPVTLLGDKKAARVDNQIILVTEVEEHAKKYNLTYKESLNSLLEEAILYFGAKISIEEPTEEQVEKKVREDRSLFASKIGKRVSEVSDDDFLIFIINNFGTKKNYIEKIKKNIWISTYLEASFTEERVKDSIFTNEEIEAFIKENSTLFEEKAGVKLSMIYFSAFTDEGQARSNADMDKQRERAVVCLQELKDGGDFRELVTKYSDDTISIQAQPPGFVGDIYLDDPRTYENLSREIVEDLKLIKEPGLISRTYATRNGIFIFYIDDRIKPKLLDEDRRRMKAKDILRIRKERELKNKLRKKIIFEMRKKADIVIF